MAIPSLEDLYNPILQAIDRLGGSASTAELNQELLNGLNLTEEELAETTSTGVPKILNRIGWSRTNLKGVGFLDKSESGIWVLTSTGKEAGTVDPRQVSRTYQRLYNAQRKARVQRESESSTAVNINEQVVTEAVLEHQLEQTWQQQLLATLRGMAPDAFERLCKRLLRESGFTKVEVTGQAGDGGIDGRGLVTLGGLLSFPIIFQCKRYQGSVGSAVVRDFRGAMIGRADRGLIITTGTFSRDARVEATRDGAPPIDLVDGEQLVEKLKDLKLGVAIKMIEEVTVIPEWFKEI